MEETVHKEKLDTDKIRFVNYTSFLMGFAQAVLLYITSSYIKIALDTENVGIYYSVSYGIILLLSLNLHKAVKRWGKSKTFIYVNLLKIFALFMLAAMAPSALGIFFLIAYIVAASLDWVVLDAILESFSVDKKSGRIRGFHLLVLNAGFIFGPLVSTQMLGKTDFRPVFLVALFFSLIVLFIAVKKLGGLDSKIKACLPIADLIRKTLKRRNILRIYYISFILEFFYAILIIYSPIYLRDLGLSWEQIGFIFTVMLLPFLIFPYPAGYAADKKIGEKELLIISVFLMGSSTALIFFTSSLSVIVWSAILFLTRIGASTIETLRDSYFYKRIDGEDVELIDFYRTARPAAFIAASAVSYAVLFFFPLKTVFIVLSAVIFSALYPALRLVDSECESETEAEPRLPDTAADAIIRP